MVRDDFVCDTTSMVAHNSLFTNDTPFEERSEQVTPCDAAKNDNALSYRIAPMRATAAELQAMLHEKYNKLCAYSSPACPPPAKENIIEFNGGASIDVSPNGSWLAWFKRLPAQAPGDLLPSPLDAAQKSNGFGATDGILASSHETSASSEALMVDEISSKSSDSPTLKNKSLGLQHLSASQETRNSQRRTQQSMKDIDEEIINRKMSRKMSVSKVAFSKNFCNRIKNHPFITVFVLIAVLAILIPSAFFALHCILFELIQRSVNAAEFKLLRYALNSPETDSLMLHAETELSRPKGHEVIIEPFNVDVLYIPNEMPPPPRRSLTWVIDPGGSFFQDDVQIHENRRLQSDEDNDNILMGQMTLPSMPLKGRQSLISYATKLQILNAQMFEKFLRDFMTTGAAQWRLRGRPAVQLMGLSFSDINFDKTLDFQGPRLAHTDEDFQALIQNRNNTDKSTEKYPSWWEDNSSPTEHEEVEFETSENNSARVSQNPMKILEFDLSHSTPAVARIHVKIDLRFPSDMTIDPVGVITLQESYHDQPIVVLKSAELISLHPGSNEVDLFGEFHKPEGLNAIHAAINDLLSTAFRGDCPILETKGVNVSIPLYLPAIQSIKLYTPINLLPGSTRHVTLPLIGSSSIKSIEITTSKKNSERFRVTGITELIVNNPFGEKGTFKIPQMLLKGSIMFDLLQMDDWPSIKRIKFAKFEGSLKGLHRSRPVIEADKPVHSRIGIMPVSVQTIPLKLDSEIDLMDNGKPLQKLIEQLFNGETTRIAFMDIKAMIRLMETPFGTLEIGNIPFEEEIDLRGFKADTSSAAASSNFKIINFNISIDSSQSETLSGESIKPLRISLDVQVPTQLDVSADMGTLHLGLLKNRTLTAHLIMSNSKIKVVNNILRFSSEVVLHIKDALKLFSLLGPKDSENRSPVTIEFVDPANYENNNLSSYYPHLDLVQKSLLGLKLSVAIPREIEHPPKYSSWQSFLIDALNSPLNL